MGTIPFRLVAKGSKAKKENHLSGYRMPSKDKLAENSEWKLLPEDDFLVEIVDFEKKRQVNPYEPEKGERDTLLVRMNVISFADKSPVVYDDGTEPEEGEDVRLVGFIDPARVGLVPQPSIARKFFAAATNTPIEDDIEVESLDDLKGVRLIATTQHRKSQAGQTRDRVVNYRPVPKRRRVAEETDDETEAAPSKKSSAAQKADAEALVSKAKAVFGEEAGF